MIIGVNGRARSGKDTISDIMVKKFNFKKVSFADPLKEISSTVFDIPLTHFHDDNLKDSEFATPVAMNITHINSLLTLLQNAGCIPSQAQIDALTAEGLAMQFVSPREIMQKVGTNLCRNHLGNTVWVDIFKRRYENYEGHLIVSDCRMLNERQLIKDFKGINFLILRPSLLRLPEDAHPSELLGESQELIDVTIINDSTKSSLQMEIELWWTAKVRTLR